MLLLLGLSNLGNSCVAQPSIKVMRGHNASVESLMFSSDGATLVSASVDQSVKLWDLKLGACKETYRDHPNEGFTLAESIGDPKVYGAVFSRDATMIASCGPDGQVTLRTTVAPETIRSFKIQRVGPHMSDFPLFQSIGMDSSGKFLASATEGDLNIWDIATGKLLVKKICMHSYIASRFHQIKIRLL